MAVALDRSLTARLGANGRGRGGIEVRRLRDHLVVARLPILALALVAILQNIDVIVAKHRLPDDAAGAYAAAAVAAKVVIWVAVGLGFHLVPEAARRAADGFDPRGVLVRALGVLAAVAVPSLLVLALVPDLVLRLGFGEQYVDGADALRVLAVAMALLAACYLAVQYLLALHRTRFLLVLGVVAIVEPVVLAFAASDESQAAFAAVVLAVQAAAAVLMLVAALVLGAVTTRGGTGSRGRAAP
jgi:O-antigen/teichoic acid export membrane protein